ncbi:MAG: FAD-binding oxidoreductase [Chloroflexi bacterium]|nr:FAD-binding oxidoreductase [Chloroflexota bacterium]MBI3734716.1 FAD-binding oxidoreductase [Chloroflexota bacterium]
MTHTEVLVIGGGVIGSSIAYHLARRGHQVLVVERAQIAVEPAASWASAGGVRRQGRHPAEAALAIEAVTHWPYLEAELDADVHYRQGGNLLVAESADEAAQLAAFAAQQREMGFADVRWLDQAEVRELVPGIGEQVVAASTSPADGQADPALTTRAFAAAAQHLGATYWTETPCHALVVSGSRGAIRISGALTSRGDVAAEAVVLAAGAWSDELAAGIGLRLPMQMHALQMVRSTPAPTGVLRPVISPMGRALSLKQLNNGSFLLGGGWPGDIAADRHGYTLRPASIAGNWAAACAILPAVGRQLVERAWCGLEAISADEIPLIGPVAGFEGLTVAVGFSGHGFAIAPAVGRAVADQLAGQPVPELDGLSPARIVEPADAQPAPR